MSRLLRAIDRLSLSDTILGGAAIGLALGMLTALAQSVPAAPILLMARGGSTSGGGGSVGDCDDWYASSNDLPTLMATAEDCTGPPAGTSLTSYTGPDTITGNGNSTVIDGKTITSCPLAIETSSGMVTIRNSRMVCSGANVLYVDDAGQYTASGNGANYLVKLENVEVDAGGYAGHCITESYVWIYRTEVHGCDNGLSVNQKIKVEESYVHDLNSTGGESHEDGMEFSCGHWDPMDGGSQCSAGYKAGVLNVDVYKSLMLGRALGDTQDGTSAIISNNQWGPDTNVNITFSVFAGGASTIYCPRSPGPSSGTNFNVTDNKFSAEYHTTIGVTGLDDCDNETSFARNTCLESGAAFNSDTSTCAIP